ncbi:hypothetical protein GQ457_06G022030 [Hibiscus cannabinus]
MAHNTSSSSVQELLDCLEVKCNENPCYITKILKFTKEQKHELKLLITKWEKSEVNQKHRTQKGMMIDLQMEAKEGGSGEVQIFDEMPMTSLFEEDISFDIHANTVPGWIMAVEAPAKYVFDFDDEYEDVPIVFKRNNTLSLKQIRLNSEIKKALSRKYDGHSGSQASNVKASTSSAKTSSAKSPVACFKTPTSSNDQSKQALKQNMSTVVKEDKSTITCTTETDSDHGDSQPLSARLKGISTRGNIGASTSGNAQSHRLVPKAEVKGSTEDPDDEASLSARFNMKSSTGTLSSKLYDSDEKKHMASKTEQNGSTMKDKQENSSILSGKRLLDKGNSSDQSSAKRPKISDTPTTMKSKQETSDEKKPMASKTEQNGSTMKLKQENSSILSCKRLLDKGNSSDQSSAKRPKILDTPTTMKSKQETSDEKKPMASKTEQNGSTMKLKQENSSILSGKRLLDKGNSSDQSSAKRPKISDTPTTMKTKQENSDEKKPMASKTEQNGSTMKLKQENSSILSCKRLLDKGNASDQSLAKRPKISDTPTTMKTKQENSDEKKSVASKTEQNGSTMKGKQENSSILSGKRLLDKGNSSDQSSAKRPKISDTPTTMKSKQENSDEKKPMASKNEQNGFTMKDKQENSSILSGRRLLDKCNSSNQSSAKRPKISDTPTTMKSKQLAVKSEKDDEEDDHIPISQRMKMSTPVSKTSSMKQKATKGVPSSLKKINKKSKKEFKNSKYIKSSRVSPSSGDGQKKWSTLVHNGVIFPPPYKPHGIKMLYEGRPVDLTPEQQEVATMFAVMKDTDYMSKPQFKKNFWEDWSKLLGKNHIIKDLDKCDFTPIFEWHLQEKEKKKQMSTEEKKALKEEKLKLEEKYMWAIVDGVKEKVGNFRVEPPGLFRGRGEHPKMGKLKRRIRPSDITINIGKDAPIPECPIPGESWKDVKHDHTVTWLAFWNDPINPKEFKYVFLAASSSLKGQSDKEKYEKARMLKEYIKNIRAAYTKDFASKDVTKRQIAVATYLIDKLALRAGNEKDDDEADTVGCCTLKVGNVECIPPNKLKFDFLGKDSIQYVNTVEVELPVYKAIGEFQTGKSSSDDLFDKLDTSKLNAHLKELMPGLTAKVFRTYNASITLDEMLNKETKDGNVAEKVIIYQHANKEVAIICNHQRSISKSHSAQMSRLTEKITELKGVLRELKVVLDRAKKGKPPLKDADGKQKRNLTPEAIEKKIAQTNAKIEKMERDMQTKEDLKTVALGTSKINYLDPRITVAWCKRHEVPIEKIFNKSLLAKFAWAMDVDPDFRF